MWSVIVFYIVLIVLIIFFQWKVSLLRSGKIDIETIHKSKSKKIKILNHTAKYFAYKLKNYLHKIFIKFALFRMKARVKISKIIENKLPGLYMFFAKRPEFADKHFKNFFWRGVIEYRYKMKRLKAQIKEEELQKSIVENIEEKEERKEEEKEPTINVQEDISAQTNYTEIENQEAPKKKRVVRKRVVKNEDESMANAINPTTTEYVNEEKPKRTVRRTRKIQ